MKSRLIEHLLSILLIAGTLGVLIYVIREKETGLRADRIKSVEQYLLLDSLDFGNPLHVALFKETIAIFHPGTPAQNDSVLREIQRIRQEEFTTLAYKTGAEERGLSSGKLLILSGMYAQFILVYLIVMVITYRAAQSLAILRFMKMKQHRSSYLAEIAGLFADGNRESLPYLRALALLVKAIVRGISYAILFSPAYVVAYSIRTSFNTDSFPFMIVLAIASNGLLINYANKFFTLLVAESRKGYVETALVKGLENSYQWGKGISYWSVLRPRNHFSSHVFSHVYMNAHHQFITTLKEHASFLVTGLIIIEMALNIQGRLGYELLQNVLYRQYDVVITIILGIFLMIKATEILVDSWFHRESLKYENKA